MAENDNSTESHAMSMVLAVAAILIIAAGAYAGITKLTEDTELENAHTRLETVLGKINSLGKGESVNFTIQGFKAENNWYLLGWGKTDISRPDISECFASSCICICAGNTADSCKKRGECAKVDFETVIVGEPFVATMYPLIGDAPTQGVEYCEENEPCPQLKIRPIEIPPQLKIIEIETTNNELSIRYYSKEYKEYLADQK